MTTKIMIYFLPVERVQRFSFLRRDVKYDYSNESRRILRWYQSKCRTIKQALA